MLWLEATGSIPTPLRMGSYTTRELSQHENQFVDSNTIYTPVWERGIVRGKCPALEHITINVINVIKKLTEGRGVGRANNYL